MACSVCMEMLICFLVAVFMTSSVVDGDRDSLTAEVIRPLPLDATSNNERRQDSSNDVATIPCEQTPVDPSRPNDPPFSEDRFRYHVVMYGRSSTTCGAAIVSRTWLITSASCAEQLTEPIVLRAGFQPVPPATGDLGFQAESILPHHNYNPGGHDSDLAHVTIVERKTRTPFNFTNRMQPVCFAPFNCQLPPASANFSMTGYDQSNGGSKDLKLYWLTLMDKQTCSRRNLGFQLTSNMICATKLTEGSCTGFLGGPVLYKNQNQYMIAGVVSSCHEDNLVIITNIQVLACNNDPA